MVSYATGSGSLSSVENIFAISRDVNSQDNELNPPSNSVVSGPHYVRRRGGHKTLVEILLKARAMPDFGLPNLAYSHVPYLAPA